MSSVVGYCLQFLYLEYDYDVLSEYSNLPAHTIVQRLP